MIGLLRAEWTKFRTVRGWWIGLALAALITIAVGLLGPAGSNISGGRFYSGFPSL